jgi:AraC-like DNA-binding protein
MPGYMDWRIEELLDRIQCHYADADLTLQALSSQLSTSPNHLSRLFVRAVGRGFHSTLVLARLQRASELLLDPHLSIKQISHSVGFRDATALFRAFQHHFHTTPGEYRKDRHLERIGNAINSRV